MSLVTPTKKPRFGRDKDEIHIVSPEPIKFFDKEVMTPQKKDSEAHQTHQDQLEVSNKVKQVYKIVHKATGALGGNGTTGAIYGELTIGSMQKVIDYLVSDCELTTASRFIDVGSGLGKPNFHALQSPGVCLSFGVELEEIRWFLAMHNLNLYLKTVASGKDDLDEPELTNHNINFICADIDAAHSLDPFTHIYMYDLGFPPSLQQSIAEKFNKSVAPRYLISYRPPKRVMEEYGYEVEFIHQMNTKMFGKLNCSFSFSLLINSYFFLIW
jgi:hypothetical protein